MQCSGICDVPKACATAQTHLPALLAQWIADRTFVKSLDVTVDQRVLAETSVTSVVEDPLPLVLGHSQALCSVRGSHVRFLAELPAQHLATEDFDCLGPGSIQKIDVPESEDDRLLSGKGDESSKLFQGDRTVLQADILMFLPANHERADGGALRITRAGYFVVVSLSKSKVQCQCVQSS